MNIKHKYKEFIKLSGKYYEIASEFEDMLYDIDTIDELKKSFMNDRLHSIADGLTNLSDNDILDWIKADTDNVKYIENAVKMFNLNNEDFDFWHIIRMGQYAYYYELGDNLHKDFIKFLGGKND